MLNFLMKLSNDKIKQKNRDLFSFLGKLLLLLLFSLLCGIFKRKLYAKINSLYINIIDFYFLINLELCYCMIFAI